ncbi:MAG TPA: hypothetical protein VJB68_05615 [Methylophilaceae bacterium]|nr:hypothetical protein [Methylophilaceae bacterium]
MHKTFCFLLACWLPLFFSATVFASSSMQVNQTLATITATQAINHSHQKTAQKDMPCAEHVTPTQAAGSHCNQADNSKTCHKSEHCGLCANFALYLPIVVTPLLAQTQSLASHVGWIASPILTPPALRPPIVT